MGIGYGMVFISFIVGIFFCFGLKDVFRVINKDGKLYDFLFFFR